MKRYARGNLINLIVFFIVAIGVITIVFALPSIDSGIKGYSTEDQSPIFTYNFSQNLTGTYVAPLNFSIYAINSSEYTSEPISFYSWISIDSSTGVLTINSTLNNETGQFNISISVYDSSPAPEGSTVATSFIVNATNDAPNFTNIETSYNMSMNELFTEYINATDEEGQYPLWFNITFSNCTHASWTGKSAGEDCYIFNLTNVTDIAAMINFTPSRDFVGTYTANITLMDYGSKDTYGCPHPYCVNDTYNVNKTTYSQVITFNVLATLSVNVSDCQNMVFQENKSNTCQINITTKESNDIINISSIAILRNYNGGVSNESWFFGKNLTNSESFTKSIDINFTPQKTEIGNWTINFTVQDLTTSEDIVSQINVYVDRNSSLNDVPDILPIDNLETSINTLTTINLTVYDEDFVIPDKSQDYGGYNETTIFNLTILNQSNLAQELNITGFDVEILYMPVLSGNIPTNKTSARIQFNVNASESGNYTINITVFDRQGFNDTETFNLTIISNLAPYWNATLNNTIILNEGDSLYLNLSQNITDPEGSSLTFSYSNDTQFPSFNLNSTTGIINITNLLDKDVGQHLVNVTVSDGYLTNTTQLNFLVYNINETPIITQPLTAIKNMTINVTTGNMNTTEDNFAEFQMFVNDSDFDILQKDFYDENLTINLTIEGPNTNLFDLNLESFIVISSVNYSKYSANFTPGKSDVGDYNITINVSDASGLSDTIKFNLSIASTEHSPVIVEIDNLNSSVEESIRVNFNASDEEDGNDTAGLLRFNATFIQGNDFINGNESIFNTTSGILNISFNSTMAGTYNINISVNDTTGRTDVFTWTLYVYDYPVIILPNSSFFFSMVENTSYQLNFTANHTVQNNLTYDLYINGILRNSTTGYGNAIEFLWNFTSNFTDETTCIGDINLTLNVSNLKLSNSTTWELSINHSNAPLKFLGSYGFGNPLNIGGTDNLVEGTNTITLTLTDFFSDDDASDSCVNQTIEFISNLTNGTSLTVSITNWINTTTPKITFTHPSSGTVIGNYSLYAQEMNLSNGSQALNRIDANNFSVQLDLTTSPVPTVSSGGGGGSSALKPISLKIIVPGPVTSKKQDKLVLPITLENTGKIALNDIFLKGTVVKNGILREDLLASFDQSTIDSLAIGEKRNLTLIVDVNTEDYGLYELTINASVKNPEYNDWAKIFINVEETEDVLERITFTEEFIVGNPECAELKELVDEAKELYNQGDTEATRDKLDQAMEACKKAIEQPPKFEVVKRFEEYFFNYVWVISIGIFIAGYFYHTYQRRKLKKETNTKENFNNQGRFIQRNIKPSV